MIAFDEDIREKRTPPIGAANLVLITVIIAVISLVCILTKIYAGAAVFGAIGLLFGGYSMGFVHRNGANMVLFGISGVSLLVCVFTFMFGFVGAL